MKRLAFPFACALLAACGSLAPQQQAEVAGCVASLPLSGKPAVDDLLAAAKASPACRALAADALQTAIREAMQRVR